MPKPVRVDAVMLETRAAMLAKRSIKAGAKQTGIELAIACIDLTTLEGSDTPERIRALCARAAAPLHGVGSVAAVCVYPSLVRTAKEALGTANVRVASVATAFPAGQAPLHVKLEETRAALDAGADEIDMVIDRGAFLSGDHRRLTLEIEQVKALCGTACLKVILETGELGSYTNVRTASNLALAAGADFIKTSTGKLGISATPATALLMAEAIRDYARRTGTCAGLKLAGGIRTTKQALGYLAIVNETLGDAWLSPRRFRLGASSLLDDLLMQRLKEHTGAYSGRAYVAGA